MKLSDGLHDERTGRPRATFVVALGGLLIIGPVSLTIYIPALPSVQRELASDLQLVQLTLSMPLLAVIAAPAIVGWLADRAGRRPIALGSLVVLIASSIVAIAADGIWTLLAARTVLGISGTCALVVGRAAIADSHAPANLTGAMARYAAAPILAMMIAPIIGGFITDHFGWRGVFAFLLVLGIVLLFLVGRGLSETVFADDGSTVGDGGTAVGRFGALMRSFAFWAYMGQSSLHFAVAVGFVASAPYLVQSRLGMGATGYGLGLMTVILGLLGGVFAAGRWAQRLSRPRQVLTGSALGFASSLILPVALHIDGVELSAALLFGPTALVAVGIGLAMPASQAGIVSAVPGLAGTAAGLSSCLQLVLAALFVHVGVLAWPRPDLAIGVITAIGMAAAVAVSATLTRPSSRH